MRSKTSSWKECFIIYDKMMEDGLQKKVKEMYVVDAVSFGEAEERIAKEMSSYISGEFEVYNINPATYKEILFMGFGEKVLHNQAKDLFRAVKKKDKAAGMEVYERSLEECAKNTDTRWYKSKLQFIAIDEKTGKEKRNNVHYLVEGCSLESARKNIDEMMSGTMIDYVIAKIEETKIIDVFEYNSVTPAH